jgi:pimeloyl-ACP methyl ester carboxylesterase
VNKPISPAAVIHGEEHWTDKGSDVRLFLWNKHAGDLSGPAGRILFVHGSSMASQPTFDLQVPGRADSSAMDFFAARGYDTWCVDMEGYGRSTKTRDNNAPIAYGADDCFTAATYIERVRGKRPLLVYGISSGALRAALFAQRHPQMVARLALDAMVWTGEGSPTLAERSKRLSEFRAKNRRPIDRKFVRSIFERDDSVPTGHLCRHVRQSAGLRSRANHGADPYHARRIRRHRELCRSHKVLRAATQPRQAIRRDAGHRPRLVPPEELRDLLSHPGKLLLAAGADLQGRTLIPLWLRPRDQDLQDCS